METEFVLLAVIALSFGGTTVVTLARALARRIERGGKIAPPPSSPAPDAERLARLEAAVESLAASVERTAEEQRFLTNLLAERSGVDPTRR